MCNIFSCNV
uniref:Atp-dependent rna helicase wm6 n=1 Tax=Triatoma infestans TaxID=30076 RepID=A0A161MK62_TRIIF